MSWEQVLHALDGVLAIPRAPRESPINMAQLRTLFLVAEHSPVDRYSLSLNAIDDQPTVDKRLDFLERKHLIHSQVRRHLRERRWRFIVSPMGQQLVDAMARGRSANGMVQVFHDIADLVDQSWLNVAHVAMLAHLATGNVMTVPLFIEVTKNNRHTVISRLRFLASVDLISVDEQFNRGGNTHPNHWRITSQGRQLLHTLFPQGFESNYRRAS